MPSMMISGRPAWIAGIVLGALMLIYGLATGQVIVPIGGGAIMGVSIVFLILSIVTRRQTD